LMAMEPMYDIQLQEHRDLRFRGNCPAIAKHMRLNDDLDPPVQEVAQKLLARRSKDEFYPAGMQLNILAAIWIQAMVHDWAAHMDDNGPDGEVWLEDGAEFGCPLHAFSFRRSLERPNDGFYNNPRTQWWDASWLYGQTEAEVSKTRLYQDGKVRLSLRHPNAKVASESENGTFYNTTGDSMNSWIGLSLLQELFLEEHNLVAEEIVKNHPEFAGDDEKIFGMTRLVISAELAKIHTIDWTIELLKTRTLEVGMKTNWYGFPKAIGYLPDFIVASLPDTMKKVGNETLADDKGVPFSLTEEFMAVYRLHALMPDQIIVHLDDNTTQVVPLSDLVGENGETSLREDPARHFQYFDSVLRYPCGNLQLHNFPHTLRNLNPTDEYGRDMPHPIDLAAVDLYRDRERGILRFNDLRRSLHLPPYDDFFHLTQDETLTAELEEVYGVDGIERCELQVGRLAEKKLPGFAISETSFTLFLLMATRRLEADPFLHQYFTEEHYSATGLNWVENTETLREVIERHYPELVKDIPVGQSAFTPRTPWPGQAV
jgi:alpha-dioxygenase